MLLRLIVSFSDSAGRDPAGWSILSLANVVRWPRRGRAGGSRVVCCAPDGEVVRSLDVEDVVDDADLLEDGRILITERKGRFVKIVDWAGNVYWSVRTSDPREADLLANGHCLIADGIGRRVIEVDPTGTVVWSYAVDLAAPHEADRLRNGNTTICDAEGNKILEVTPEGREVWRFTALNHPDDLDRRMDLD